MSFLLDSDICSAYLRQRGPLFTRFMQHGGQLWISTITLSDLYTWAYKQDDPKLILGKVDDFLRDVKVLPFDHSCVNCRQAGRDPHSWIQKQKRQATTVGVDAEDSVDS